MLKAADRPGAIVLTRVRPGPDLEQAKAAVEVMQLPLAPAIGDRVAYKRAVASGQAVVEFEPEGKAAGEIKALWRWIRHEEKELHGLRTNSKRGAREARTSTFQTRQG